jgi:hypothetical protein
MEIYFRIGQNSSAAWRQFPWLRPQLSVWDFLGCRNKP